MSLFLQVNSNGQASSSGVSSGPPGSNHVGSLNHARPAIIRRSHDSGFDQQAAGGAGAGTILVQHSRDQQSPLKSGMTDVRWSPHHHGVMDPHHDPLLGLVDHRVHSPNPGAGAALGVGSSAADELMHLLDLIQVKSEKLKSDLDPQQKRAALQAINEDSSPLGNLFFLMSPMHSLKI